MVRLLIVDDSPISRKLVRRALPDDLEYEIEEAEDGAEAVAKYAELAPDLVIMDLIMPVMTGLEATGEIVGEDADARILALTSDIQDTTKNRLLEAGVRAVLHKPVRREDLGEALRQHARSR